MTPPPGRASPTSAFSPSTSVVRDITSRGAMMTPGMKASRPVGLPLQHAGDEAFPIGVVADEFAVACFDDRIYGLNPLSAGVNRVEESHHRDFVRDSDVSPQKAFATAQDIQQISKAVAIDVKGKIDRVQAQVMKRRAP